MLTFAQRLVQRPRTPRLTRETGLKKGGAAQVTDVLSQNMTEFKKELKREKARPLPEEPEDPEMVGVFDRPTSPARRALSEKQQGLLWSGTRNQRPRAQ